MLQRGCGKSLLRAGQQRSLFPHNYATGPHNTTRLRAHQTVDLVQSPLNVACGGLSRGDEHHVETQTGVVLDPLQRLHLLVQDVRDEVHLRQRSQVWSTERAAKIKPTGQRQPDPARVRLAGD